MEQFTLIRLHISWKRALWRETNSATFIPLATCGTIGFTIKFAAAVAHTRPEMTLEMDSIPHISPILLHSLDRPPRMVFDARSYV